MTFYKNKNERLADILTANSTKIMSERNGCLVPASDYDKAIHKEEKAAASARLAIDKAMRSN
ncbi:hypothetical protein [Pseudoalteromonas nigrifaciens]|uniref:hypothetical protein n=1 Tax=Pseudoalteromonas nigrifaciens TaxID=28109 RepID=UPI003FD175EA